ncbi:hypothetical protein AGDE_12646 [Angomonas deanei]|uniref:Uncharacterized protein n=1 Tax=Angomonas deanei TaxID=59799 RepID=A0A7G2C5N2_9TRYP|nr:hypothetical protein AGDE_12646 [Angomonas deanei]CAD2215040.1 hypothetical protein, conserved [Angomonas deanei]|eukprot:EPY23910.1 hypothetical protein AGDE_12646 [Angomonas deanei]
MMEESILKKENQTTDGEERPSVSFLNVDSSSTRSRTFLFSLPIMEENDPKELYRKAVNNRRSILQRRSSLFTDDGSSPLGLSGPLSQSNRSEKNRVSFASRGRNIPQRRLCEPHATAGKAFSPVERCASQEKSMLSVSNILLPSSLPGDRPAADGAEEDTARSFQHLLSFAKQKSFTSVNSPSPNQPAQLQEHDEESVPFCGFLPAMLTATAPPSPQVTGGGAAAPTLGYSLCSNQLGQGDQSWSCTESEGPGGRDKIHSYWTTNTADLVTSIPTIISFGFGLSPCGGLYDGVLTSIAELPILENSQLE